MKRFFKEVVSEGGKYSIMNIRRKGECDVWNSCLKQLLDQWILQLRK